MHENTPPAFIAAPDDPILVTGAAGFIGSKVIERLVERGFRNLRAFARPSSDLRRLEAIARRLGEARLELIKGNLQSRDDCVAAAKDAVVIFHLAAARGEKSFPDAFMNTVVTTRNLLEGSVQHGTVRRFVTVSSFAVYGRQQARQRVLDESCPLDARPDLRGDAYGFAKLKQDEIVMEYGTKFRVPYVIVRPGYVYGPGNEAITGRVGIGTFGLFLHLGGPNPIPITYVDNCAEAIVLAGLTKGVDGEVFNVVDDDLPSSRTFLCLYKKNVTHFRSLYLPHAVSYALCCLWEKYSVWSGGQLPPTYSRGTWHTYWKRTTYSNRRLKTRLGWSQPVARDEAFRRYFESCREKVRHA